MGKIYVSASTLDEAINYFTHTEYSSPEQLGLFFLFKGMKFNSKEYHTFYKEGEARKKNTLLMYFLCGLFDSRTENGGKRCGLFPFSFSTRIKAGNYYNGGSEFRKLLGRVKDTMDNALIDESNYLRKDELDTTKYKFRPDYIPFLYDNCLHENKIPLKYFAAWYFRFFPFEVDDSWISEPSDERYEDFTRICTKELIRALNLTAKELSNLFDTETGLITYQDTQITGDELRSRLTFDGDATSPEISALTVPIDYMDTTFEFSAEQVNELITPHGNNITAEKLLSLLLGTKQVVLTGPPGTGKSYISGIIKRSFDTTYLVQFHPNLTYEQFIGGNKFAEDGSVIPQAGVFLEFCETARNDTQHKYLFLIDEINRANVSKVFGEIILTLDREYTAQLPAELKTKEGTLISEFSIPENVYILATMNSADRSIALVDYAIRRRFAFVNFYPNSEIIDYMSDYSNLPAIKVSKLMNGINSKLLSVLGDADLLLGQSYFMPKWAIDSNTHKILWSEEVLLSLFNYYILPIIEEYTYGNKRYLTNILGDKLPTRIDDSSEFMREIRYQFGN